MTSTPPHASAGTLSRAADSAAAASLDRYVSGFGRTWGDASAFSGYVGVARDGQLFFGKAYGKADRDGGVLAGPDTPFRIASTTKVFTAIAILQLEERGLLRIDDAVRRYLPELPDFADPVTIHHCLTHTSGLPPLPDDEGLVAETGQPHRLDGALASYKDSALLFTPGERFQYSNSGFTVLGAIIERVSGQSYEAYMREHVFGPAGMLGTTTVSRPSAPAGAAVGYNLDPHGNLEVAKPITYVTFGCGAIFSTVNDLVAFDHALSGERLLSEASKREMFTPEQDPGGIVPFPSRYGLGWLITHDVGHEVLYHPGGVDGFEASFARVPDSKITVVVLSNRFGNMRRVLQIAHAAEVAALTGNAPPPEVEPPATSVPPSTAKALVGEYKLDAASLAALRSKFTPDIVEARTGLSLTSDGGYLRIEQQDAEIFETAAGSFLTKQTDLRLSFEPGRASAAAVVVAPAQPDTGMTLRYVRLPSSIEPPPSGACPAGMVRFPGGVVPGDHGGTVAPFCLGRHRGHGRCVCELRALGPVPHPEGDGLGGVHDLAGNVAEWTSTTAPKGHVLKGSGWHVSDPAGALPAAREVIQATFRAPIAGFRCAR